MTGAAPVLLAAAADGGGTGVPLRELLLVGLTAAAMTYLLTSAVRVFAIRAGAVAVPRVRDVHVIPTPRLGGLGMFGGVVAGIALAANLPALNRGFAYTTDMTAVIAAGTVIVLVGVVDDRWGLDALTKFVGQLTAAGVLVLLGISWLQLYIPFADIGTLVLDPLQAGLLTVAITVATINAINFVDGLDGLAAGLGLIAAAAICMFSLGLLRDQGGDVSYYPPALISVALAGACLGFLPHNFSPARIFMGDVGSLPVGALLGYQCWSLALGLGGRGERIDIGTPVVEQRSRADSEPDHLGEQRETLECRCGGDDPRSSTTSGPAPRRRVLQDRGEYGRRPGG